MPYAASAIALTDNDTRWAPSIHTDLVMFAIFYNDNSQVMRPVDTSMISEWNTS